MDLIPIFQISTNAWILCVPFLVPAFLIGALRKDIAKRMSDMTGYEGNEKIVTIAASLAPYPFMITTVWAPFSSIKSLFIAGLIVYSVGILAFYATIYVFATTPPDKPLSAGVYLFSRNPMYVSATFVFLGICMITANLLLFAFLVIVVVLQHFMILAEERICRLKYGESYQEYFEKVPRYLFFCHTRPEFRP
jgi:protein-S-isoprenylcysteine O-methyltransferase Ste14